MSGRSLFTADAGNSDKRGLAQSDATRRDSYAHDARNPFRPLITQRTLELPRELGETEIVAATGKLLSPALCDWPADLVGDFSRAAGDWLARNNRRLIALTSATRADTQGPIALVVLHHVPERPSTAVLPKEPSAPSDAGEGSAAAPTEEKTDAVQ